MNPLEMTPDEMKEARRALGMTQKQLADVLELEGEYRAHTVRSWENGKRPISGPVRVAMRLMLKHGVKHAKRPKAAG